MTAVQAAVKMVICKSMIVVFLWYQLVLNGEIAFTFFIIIKARTRTFFLFNLAFCLQDLLLQLGVPSTKVVLNKFT